MEYLDLGMVLGTISVPIVMYYLLTMESVFNEELTRWWNGQSYRSADILLEILGLTFIALLTFLLMSIGYPVIIGVVILIKIIVSLRNKRLEAIKNQN